MKHPDGMIEIALPGGVSVRSRMHRWIVARSSGARCAGAAMIALHSDVQVYLACGYTDMRKGMQGLAMLVQQVLAEDPFSGALWRIPRTPRQPGAEAGSGMAAGIGLCGMLTKRGWSWWPLYLADDEHGLDRVVGRASCRRCWKAASGGRRPVEESEPLAGSEPG